MFPRFKVDAPLVPGVVDVVNGLRNSQHSRAETFCAVVTISVAMSCLGVATRVTVLYEALVEQGADLVCTDICEQPPNDGEWTVDFKRIRHWRSCGRMGICWVGCRSRVGIDAAVLFLLREWKQFCHGDGFEG